MAGVAVRGGRGTFDASSTSQSRNWTTAGFCGPAGVRSQKREGVGAKPRGAARRPAAMSAAT
jgi:hypothetical protein